MVSVLCRLVEAAGNGFLTAMLIIHENIVKTKRKKVQYRVIYNYIINPVAPRNFVGKHSFKLVDHFLVNAGPQRTKTA